MHASVMAAAAAARTHELREQAKRDRDNAVVRCYRRSRRSSR